MSCTVLAREARLKYRKRGCVQYSSRERIKVDVQKERYCTVLARESRLMHRKRSRVHCTILARKSRLKYRKRGRVTVQF
jgi:hypothetical protein